MIILPIVERELRVAARRPLTYRARFWAVCAVLVIVAWRVMNFAWQGTPGALQGRSVFNTISGLAFLYTLFIGARLTADCLSREKREGTLGLLFLTDLRPWDVVLGKLAANSLSSFYGLIAVLPIMALPLLLGGVTLLEVFQMGLLLLNTLFFSLCVGMMVSAVSRNDRKSMMGTVVVILTPLLGPAAFVIYRLFVQEALTGAADYKGLMFWALPDPLYPLFYLMAPRWTIGLGLPAWSFWASLGIVHLMGWIALLTAMAMMPFVWKENAVTALMTKLRRFADQWSRGAGAARDVFRREWLRVNPFLWLVARDRLKPWYAWTFLIATIVIWIRGYVKYGDVMFDFYPLIPTAILIHLVLKVWILAESTHRLVEDQRSGALELLLVTPLTISHLVRGQFLALKRQFALPLAALGVVELLAFSQTYHWSIILAGLLVLIADAIALVWVGMYLSLSGKSLNRVIASSIGLVLLLPQAIYMFALAFVRWCNEQFFFGEAYLSFNFKVALWLAVGLAADFVIGYCWARSKLLRETNSAIVQRFVLAKE